MSEDQTSISAVQNRINTNKVKAETKHLVSLEPIKVTLRRFWVIKNRVRVYLYLARSGT
ncbi:MAG: hypothetical protein QGF78_02250 [Candidatus Bathyarchaeota archaeon]|nr:hypothetical protein [Candidatus Bathyarchaeota archaeon]